MTAETELGEEVATAVLSERLNWLRAGVLGANDGIVSTAGVVFGVAGASNDRVALLVAGLAATVAGALSMAGGEYVSVSSQRDIERVNGVHADEIVSPWVAARASFASFVAGAAIPLLGVVATPAGFRLWATLLAVLVALVVTGSVSARLSGVGWARPVLRNVLVGSAAMGLTYCVGLGIGGVL
ncbi:MAG: VIT1/CCC1 transporter family protein [Propionibacteriaceae bacterium]|jgi:VIT1/CCC1 family predicted Fe2+/Mn2+ transporter|nr:VIT1/CCC1 transporter family protein [Propionibacteriaceae bacterium]